MGNDHDESDSNVWRALFVIRETAEKSELQTGPDACETELRRILLQPRTDANARAKPVRTRLGALIYRLSGRSQSTEACIEWLRRTGSFTDYELDLIRRVKLFYENGSGKVLMRQKPLSEAHAAAVLTVLTFVAGIWVGWILHANNAGVQDIAASILLGGLLGTIARRALDYSFRFVRLRNKVITIAPLFQGEAQA